MKIGITTHYYNSNNYGGNLQAYALCKYLNKKGFCAEQICYEAKTRTRGMRQVLKEDGLLGFTKKAISKLFAKLNSAKNKKRNKKIKGLLGQREQAIKEFNVEIPHSDIVYNQDTIVDANDKYDIFITGSDQVWHPSAINKAYSLEFVKDKPKISYAASISVSELDARSQEYFKSFIKDYTAVSVREKNAVELLKDISPVPIDWVLDPTMLLSEGEWLEVVEECDVKEKFIFCYFLGNDRQERIRAKEFAKEHGLKIVDIPHLQGKYEKADKNFADISVYDASPGQFLWLIKNAEYVFTDSFHSTVFSLIFQKQFFVFERVGHKGMGERILSLLNLFDIVERFATNEKNKDINYMSNLQKIDYSQDFTKFKRMQEHSLNFLLENTTK